ERLGVGELAAREEGRDVVQRDLLDRDRLVVHQTLIAARQAGRQEERDPLGTEAGRGEEAGQFGVVRGAIAGLLLQFARRRRLDRLAGLVQRPGGDLQ